MAFIEAIAVALQLWKSVATSNHKSLGGTFANGHR
jgi:hypothetical protein